AAPGYERLKCLKTVDEGQGRVEAAPLRRADGSTVFMEFSNTRIEVDGKDLVLAIGHDVTEEVQAAQALEAAESRYRSLLEAIPDVIWTCDTTGRLHFATANLARISGFTPEEFYGRGPELWLGRI